MNMPQVVHEMAIKEKKESELITNVHDLQGRVDMLKGVDLSIFRQSDVDEAQAELDREEQKLAKVREQIANLKSRLPDDATLAQAHMTLAELMNQHEAVTAQYEKTYRRFIDVLKKKALPVGRELNKAFNDAGDTISKLKQLREETGIEFEVPSPPTASQSKLAWLIALWLSEVAVGEPTETTERDLANLL